jgi:uncharacterized protein (TIGR03435 family)
MSEDAVQPRERRYGLFRRAVLAALIAAALMGLTAQAQDIAGTWQGTMQAGKEQRIVVKISKTENTGWQGVVYSLDANMAYEGRAMTQMSLRGGELQFTIAPIDSSYQGKLNDDGKTIAGSWTQSGKSYALNLVRVAGDAVWEIPKADAMMPPNADPDWDVVSVKARDPNDPSGSQSLGMQGRQFVISNKTVALMLEFAYGVQKKQVVGGPAWIETERWDVAGVPDIPGHTTLKQAQILVRKLLEERFGLKVHRENKELAVYAITVAKGGAKLTKSLADPNNSPDERDNSNGGIVVMRLTNTSMSNFALALFYWLDQPAVDQTGLTGRYDFQLKWTNDESRAPTDGSAPPLLFTAIQEQLGLKLDPVKAPVQVLVVDAVERPTAN